MYYQCNLLHKVEKEIIEFIKDRSEIKEYLFFSEYTKKKRPLPALPDYIAEKMNKLFNKKRFGNDRIVPYSMRHTFATNLIKGIRDEDGSYKVFPTPILIVSKLLNHANVETTEKNYAHCTINDAELEIDAFGTLMF